MIQKLKITMKERRNALALILIIVLLNPCFYFRADNIHINDKIFAWITCITVGIALFAIDLFMKGKAEKLFLSILFILSLAPNLTVWSYLDIGRVCIKLDMFWVIFATDRSESKEFFQHFITWKIVLTGVLYTAAGLILIVRQNSLKALRIKRHRMMFCIPVAIVMSCIAFQYTVQAIPTFDLYKSRIIYERQNRIFHSKWIERQEQNIDVKCCLNDTEPHTFVIVIGESASAAHQSLYGYHRKTTPLLDSIKEDLNIYTQVVTSATHTAGSLLRALTFATYENPDAYMDRPDVVNLLNSAGFNTRWITNQPVLDKIGGFYGIAAKEAQTLTDLSRFQKDDGEVLPYIQEIVEDTVDTGNRIIFVHLLGNHHSYKSRYPENWKRFDHNKSNDIYTQFAFDEYRKRIIDEYDNSILYGDFVLFSIIQQMKKISTPACLLFFSDHGEEIYDFRDFRGHSVGNPSYFQARIPFLFWSNDEYRQEMKDLTIDTARVYSTEELIHSISDLCGLKHEFFKPEHSIFSKNYKKPEQILVSGRNYEDVMIQK
ncbi:MAG: phosphoethanolamine transferase [Dysgonamonadaceae bacterium]|jgi:heptose-I-phosphate ethanolaminephosphotransferase|nr:phosphoethanolamine transferase [Dysgonamonadaceae bacterium]